MHTLEEEPLIALPVTAAEEAKHADATPEEQERQTNERIASLRTKIEEIVALSHGDVPPEIESARNDLLGADAKSIDAQKLNQISQKVQDESAKQNQQLITGAALSLSFLGALSAGNIEEVLAVGKQLTGKRVAGDGQEMSPELLCTAAMGHGIENAPQAARRQEETALIQHIEI